MPDIIKVFWATVITIKSPLHIYRNDVDITDKVSPATYQNLSELMRTVAYETEKGD